MSLVDKIVLFSSLFFCRTIWRNSSCLCTSLRVKVWVNLLCSAPEYGHLNLRVYMCPLLINIVFAFWVVWEHSWTSGGIQRHKPGQADWEASRDAQATSSSQYFSISASINKAFLCFCISFIFINYAISHRVQERCYERTPSQEGAYFKSRID